MEGSIIIQSCSIAAVFVAELSRALLPLFFPKKFPLTERLEKSAPDRKPGVDDARSSSVHTFRESLEIEKTRKVLDGQRITLDGFFYPGLLLTNGWWERGTHRSLLPSENMTNGLQKWLIHGFEQWAPSWECSFGKSPSLDKYVIGQIGEGDEADSMPVIVPREKALDILEYFGSSATIRQASMASRVCVSARLEVAKTLDRDLQSQLEQSIPGWTKHGRHCLLLDEDNKNHFIYRESNTDRGIYSGYLWQCVCPAKQWRAKGKEVSLEDVFFVWEHTDFACGDAVKFGVDALVAKREILEKHVGKTVLLQRSAWVVETRTRDHPVLSADEFWQFVKPRLERFRQST
jgi:hypothetical protein